MIRKMTCRAALAAALSIPAHAATTITYEDAVLGAQGYINNTPYTAAGATHSNSFTDWGGGWTSWDGFAISNKTNTAIPGHTNQYSVWPGAAANGTQFAVGYCDSWAPNNTFLTFTGATSLAGCGADFANTTYAVLDMMNGSSFNLFRKFGGSSGNDPDFLKLTITGYLNNVTTGSVNFYLADFTFADNSQDYIRQGWTHVDFSPLNTVDKILFTMTTTDVGTPTYFAMDNLVVPETSTISLAALAGLGLLRRNRKGSAHQQAI